MTLSQEEIRIIEKYGTVFSNTGGNDVRQLLERDDVNPFNNAVVCGLQIACYSQVTLLMRLEREGILK